jgi:hypothetical protein
VSQSADAAIQRWSDIVHGLTRKGPLKASNIYVRGDVIYSYGTHFELARPIRNKKGEVVCFLLNGDSYSNTTSKHQASVRGVVGRDPHVIIPYSALTQAGVDFDSIQILGRLEDRYVHTDHHSDTMPESARWHVRDDMRSVNLTDAEVQELLDSKHAEKIRDWEHRVQWAADEADKAVDGYWSQWVREHPEPPERPGAEVLSSWELRKSVKVGEIRTLHTSNGSYAQEITVTTLPDGSTSYDWETSRHFLGESLIRANVKWWEKVPCKSCWETGWAVGAARSERSWDRDECTACRGRGETIREHHRWATFLSGFDHQEARPLYFFCELPYRCKATTVAEAYEALKPDPVKLAEQMGRTVTRQGDIFAVPTRMDRKALIAKGARLGKRTYILHTNHTATEVAYLPGGLTLARGVLYHDPAWRAQDHVRRRLGDGKTWHIVVKNTVPKAGRR